MKLRLIFFIIIIFYSCNSKFSYITNKNDIRYKSFITDLKKEKSFVSIERKKETFYLYYPCDFSYQKSVAINNDKIIVSLGETSEFFIDTISEVNNITEYTLYNDEGKAKLLKKMVNDKCLFRFQINDFDYLFLTTSTVDLNKYPLIIHNCKEKEAEMEFDALDLKEMWSKN